MSDKEILERAPSYHLMMPVTAYQGNAEILTELFACWETDPGVAQLSTSSPTESVHATIPEAAELPYGQLHQDPSPVGVVFVIAKPLGNRN